MAVSRSLLRDQVRDELIARIIDGRLPPASSINEVALAADLGVSRTPLKEALLSLQRDGFVLARPATGFGIVPLTADELRETYPMLTALEALALRGRRPTASEVASWRALNGRLPGPDPVATIQIDDALHEAMLGVCSNRRLLRAIRALKLILRRYAYAYPSAVIDPRDSPLQHEAIIDALAAQDLPALDAALVANYDDSLARLLAAMAQEAEPSPG